MIYQLPELPYAYDALEPHYDEQTLRLHHGAHHKGYVDGLNKAVAKLARARETDDYALIKHWERELAFHGAGHVLHCLFWENMTPQGGGEPQGALAQQIAKDFGSFTAFKKHFSAATAAVEGSGWGILAFNPHSSQLEIMTAEKHQDLSIWGVTPLLVCDVWEHAYYLKYQNRRPAWIEAWWNLINWRDVEKKLAQASNV
ncbi:MAG: superoxide dismutase [Firmicutes bacterium]|nr:superoxide dismutase [Bacillota bacterium]